MCPLEKGVRGIEISGLLPQFGTTPMDDDGGRNP
jgi:hypothetical protein